MKRRAVLLEPLDETLDLSSLRDRDYDVVTMFPDRDAPSVLNTSAFEAAIQEWLLENNFECSNGDAFVLSGRSTKLAIALASIINYYRGEEYVNILMFDGRSNHYVDRKI